MGPGAAAILGHRVAKIRVVNQYVDERQLCGRQRTLTKEYQKDCYKGKADALKPETAEASNPAKLAIVSIDFPRSQAPAVLCQFLCAWVLRSQGIPAESQRG